MKVEEAEYLRESFLAYHRTIHAFRFLAPEKKKKRLQTLSSFLLDSHTYPLSWQRRAGLDNIPHFLFAFCVMESMDLEQPNAFGVSRSVLGDGKQEVMLSSTRAAAVSRNGWTLQRQDWNS